MPFNDKEQDLRENPYGAPAYKAPDQVEAKTDANGELTPRQIRNNKILAGLTAFFVSSGLIGAGWTFYEETAKADGDPYSGIGHMVFSFVLAFFLWRARSKVKLGSGDSAGEKLD